MWRNEKTLATLEICLRRCLLIPVVGCCVLGLSGPVRSQEDPAGEPAENQVQEAPEIEESAATASDEIFVTATKAGEVNLQDTSLSITAFSADQLDRSVISEPRDLSQFVPNLTISENTTLAQVYIRGIGTNAVFAGADPSSTIHLDGVYIGRPAATFSNFLDVERIEVLRGPQGTLYGRNSAGGTINIITRRPGDLFKSRLQLTAGNFDLYRVEGYASGPLSADRVFASISFQHSERSGYRDVIAPNRLNDDVDDEDVQAVRGQLRLAPKENTEILLRLDTARYQQKVIGYSKVLVFPSITPVVDSAFGDFDTLAVDGPNIYDRSDSGISLAVNAVLGKHATLSSLTAYRENDVFFKLDTDASDLRLLISSVDEQSKQLSQELNLIIGYDAFDLIAGAYYYADSARQDTIVRLFSPGFSLNILPDVETTSWAIFGQATIYVNGRLSLIMGLRYTDEKKDFDQDLSVRSLADGALLAQLGLFQTSRSDQAITPKLGLDYRVSDDLLVYFSVTEGFKSGGYNLTITNPDITFGPEEIRAYEVGLKGDFIDNRLRVNAAGFYYDYADLQVLSFVQTGVVDITNAATATVTGLEIEIRARPTSQLNLTAAFALLNAEYDKFPQAVITGGAVIDASGNSLNSAPKTSLNLAVQYDIPLSRGGAVFLRGEYNWQDDVFFTFDNNSIETQDSYGLANASIGYEAGEGKWRLMLWARNLGDEGYVTGTAAFPPAGISGRPGPPRTVGLRFGLNF